MSSVIAENADIKTFFESKLCADVVGVINDFAKPHLFKVGQEISLRYTFIDGVGHECWSESWFEIVDVDYDELRVYIKIDEDENQLFGDWEEEEGVWLDISLDLDENHYIQLDGTGYDMEWKEERDITLENYKIEAKDIK
jgi:hypothetical protein